MSNTKHATLLDRLKAATGQDPDLDLAIGEAMGIGFVDDYTGSIDAAVRLVPAWWWIVGRGQINESEPLGCAQIFMPGTNGGTLIGEAEHAQAPIALCMAALRAHEATTVEVTH